MIKFILFLVVYPNVLMDLNGDKEENGRRIILEERKNFSFLIW
jgi:hypothetical protein